MKARVTRKTHSRREKGRLVTYRKGHELDVSERELAAFGDRLEVVQAKTKPKQPKAEEQSKAEGSAEGKAEG